MTDSASEIADGWDFPELGLSEPEHVWLEAVYEEFREGNEVVPRILKAKLEEQLPRDFNPKEIDRRLLSGPTRPTLLGVYHVDPRSELINLCDRLIRHIQEKARTQVEIGKIDLAGLADEWNVTHRDLSNAYELMPPRFPGGGSGRGGGHRKRTLWTSLKPRGDDALARIASYRGLEVVMKEMVEDMGPDGRLRPAVFDASSFDQSGWGSQEEGVLDAITIKIGPVSISRPGDVWDALKAWWKRRKQRPE